MSKSVLVARPNALSPTFTLKLKLAVPLLAGIVVPYVQSIAETPAAHPAQVHPAGGVAVLMVIPFGKVPVSRPSPAAGSTASAVPILRTSTTYVPIIPTVKVVGAGFVTFVEGEMVSTRSGTACA